MKRFVPGCRDCERERRASSATQPSEAALLRENRALRRLLVRAVRACDPFCVVANAHSHRVDVREIIRALNRLTAPKRRGRKK